MITDTGPELLRLGEVASLMAISRSQAYQLALDGRLPGVVRIGTSVRIHRRTLLAWLDAQSRTPAVSSGGRGA